MGLRSKLNKYRGKILITLLNNFAFSVFAIRGIIVGSTLLDLEILVQEDFATTSRLMIALAVGYFAGGVLVGLIEHLGEIHLLLCLSNLFGGAMMILIPLQDCLPVMATFVALSGASNAFFDLLSHKSVINTWGKRSANFVQLLHMSYGIGALLTPLLVRPFLLPLTAEIGDDLDRYRMYYHPDEVQVLWPYLVPGCLSIILGGGYAFCYFDRKAIEEEQDKVSRTTTASMEPKSNGFETWRTYSAIFWVALMASISFSLQTIACCYAQAFGVKSALKMEKQSAALVATVFWAIFTFSKALFVGLSLVVDERYLIHACLLVFLAAIFLYFTFVTTIEYCLWAASVLLGFGFSPLFAVAFATPAKYFRMSGRQMSIILLVGILGDSTHTPLVGALLSDNPNIYAYYLGGLGTVFCLLSLGLPYWCEWLFEQNKIREINEIVLQTRPRLGSIFLPTSLRDRLDSRRDSAAVQDTIASTVAEPRGKIIVY